MEHVACILCGTRGGRRAFSVRGFSIVRCGCGLLYTNPRLRAPALAEMYSAPSYFEGTSDEVGYGEYEATADLRRQTFARWLRDVERALPGRGRLLDVGCATGLFLEVARDAGWSATGLELSAFAAGRARARGFEVIATPLESTEWRGEPFDLITMWDVIEHLPDPGAAVARARALLRPGGHLAVVTPNAASLHARVAGRRWFLLKPEEHLYYFAPATIRRLLESRGFRVSAVRRSGQYQSVDFVARRLAGYGRAMGALARGGARALGLAGRTLYVDSSCLYALARAV